MPEHHTVKTKRIKSPRPMIVGECDACGFAVQVPDRGQSSDSEAAKHAGFHETLKNEGRRS